MVIDLNKRRADQERVDAERQAIVKRIVERIDTLILTESDGSMKVAGVDIELADVLTERAAVLLLSYAYSQSKSMSSFSTEFDRSLIEVIQGEIEGQKVPIYGWIKVQVAKNYVDKAAILFNDRLREYDRVN